MEDRRLNCRADKKVLRKSSGRNKGTLLELDALVNKIDDPTSMFLLFSFYDDAW